MGLLSRAARDVLEQLRAAWAVFGVFVVVGGAVATCKAIGQPWLALPVGTLLGAVHFAVVDWMMEV